MAVIQRPVDGELKAETLPHVGFGPSRDGPFEWFPAAQLPEKPKLTELFNSGKKHIEFAGMNEDGAAAVILELERRGAQMTKFAVDRPASWSGKFRIETLVTLSDRFERAAAKIGFNYLAWSLGADVALRRRYVSPGGTRAHAFLPNAEPPPC